MAKRGMNERIQRLREQSVTTPVHIDLERAKIETDFYKENDGKYSVPVMRAMTLKEYFSKKTLYFGDDELILGEKGKNPQASPTFPELCCHSEEDMKVMSERKLVSFHTTEEDRKLQAAEIIPFWKGRTIREKLLSRMTPEWHDCYEAGIFTEFMVDMSKPGIELGPLDKLGLRMDSCCEVYFNDVELDESDIFGTEGNGFNRGVSDFNFERWLVGACDYGNAICAYEDALRHANQREAFGKTIGRFQLNQLKITEMTIRLNAMKNMLYEAAWNADNNNGEFDAGEAAMCKYYCANAAFKVVDDGMQIMGGISVASEHRINRFWRDLRVDRISGGTDEMMILTTAKNALKKYR